MKPLVPADVDLRGMPFMPLDVCRLRDSQLAISASGDEFSAAVLLWCASWNQVPAASLPTDEASLAAYAGYGRDVKGWLKVKNGALRGFVLCDDGRLYHPVVTEKALEAWAEREQYQDEKANETERKKRERLFRKAAFAALRGIGVVPEWNVKTSLLREMVRGNGLDLSHHDDVTSHTHVTVTGHAPDTAKTGTGTGTGIKDQDQELEHAPHTHPPQDTHATASPAAGGVCDPSPPSPEVLAAIGLRKLGVRITPQNPELIASVAEGVTPEALLAMAETYPGKPAGYVISACRRQRAEAANPSAAARASPAGKPSIAQQFAEKNYQGTPDDQLPEYLRTHSA